MLKRLKSLFAPAASEPNGLLVALREAFPSGPVRRGSLRGARGGDTKAVIDEILVFDGGDHWFFLFLGCRALGLPFELSVRTAKRPDDDGPPKWPIEPATRVANAIESGAECALGATWQLGEGAIPSFAGVVTLRDLQFGRVEPTAVWQLVPITTSELALEGNERRALFDRLYDDRARMLGIADA